MNRRIFVALLLFIYARLLAGADPLDTWIQRSPIPTANDLTGIFFANGQFRATGGRIFLSSPDGASWTVLKLTASNTMSSHAYSMVFGGGQFVAVGGGGTILTSPMDSPGRLNGLEWINLCSVWYMETANSLRSAEVKIGGLA